MKRIQLAAIAGGLVLSASAFANVSSQASAGTDAKGVMLVQRSVYVPVDPKANPQSPDMLVVERQAFIPADQLQSQGSASNRSSQASGTGATPTAVFVVVPADGAKGSGNGSGAQKTKRIRQLDHMARNNPRCSDVTGALPEECFAKGGTGAAATASTQGQSGR
jgi:hypothetical protein